MIENYSISQLKNSVFKTVGVIVMLVMLLPTDSFAQNGIIGAGFSSGWGNPGNITYFGAGAGSSRIATRNPSGTGNQFFRMVRGWGGNNSEFSPSAGCCGGCDLQITTFNTEIVAGNTNCTNGAWYINCPNTTDNYVFKTPDGPSGTSFVVFRVQGAVRQINTVTQSPAAGNVAVSQGVVVTATPNAALSTGQAVYLRYTTNGFTTSTVAQMTLSGSDYTATIPGQASGTTVNYYIFTSGTDNVATNGSNADFYTINLNNNGGPNYSYTVANRYLSASTGLYNSGSTWLGGIAPPANAAIEIRNAHNVTINGDVTVSSVTINAGGTLTGSDATPRILTINNNTTSTTFNNTGTWNNGSGGSIVSFTGSAIHTISGTSSFTQIRTASGLNFGANSTVSNTFTINGGGFVSGSAPTYGIGSTLVYNSGGGYGRGLEWSATSGAGYPNNVQISSNTTLDLSANGGVATARVCAGNLTIDDGSGLTMNNMTASLTVNGNATLGSAGTANLTLSNAFGGDFLLGGNWTRNSSSTLVNNNRQFSFIGGASQSINGTTTFDFLRVNNTGGIILNNTINVNSQLDLSAGRITLGIHDIVMGAASNIINASQTSFIITNSTGEVSQQVAAAQKIFPVGFNSTNYTPVRLLQNGTTDVLSVRVVSAPPFSQAPNNATRMVNLEWYITENVPGGNSLETEFEWRNTNEAGSFNRTNGVFHAHWNGSAFGIRNANVAGSNPYTTTSTNDYSGNLSNQLFVIGNVNGILSCLSTVSAGDWNTGSTWAGGIVPPSGSVVCLNHSVTVNTTDPSTMNSVTLNAGADLSIGAGRTFTIANNGSIINSSGSARNLGAGTLNLLGSALINGQPFAISNMNSVGTVTNIATINLSGTLTISAPAASFCCPITYGSSSTLLYSVGGTKNVGNEWYINNVVAGSGTPNNVIVDTTSTINLPLATIGMGGNLTIEGTINLNASSGDLRIGGNWLRRTGGVFNPNNRAVFFAGNNPSTITLEGGGTEEFNYLICDKTLNSVTLSNSPATSVTVSASVGNVFELRNTTNFNLNGQTLSLTGTGGNINIVSGSAQISGGSGSLLSISNGTKTVSSSAGTLAFGTDVLIALNSGMNFGNNLSTINGTLQIALGGFVTGNAPTYGTNSILRYFSGTSYGRGLEWSATSGPGFPYHVEISFNGTPTTLDLSNGGSAVRSTSGNLTIHDGAGLTMGNMTDRLEVGGDLFIGEGSSGSLTLSTSIQGDLHVAGDITQNSGATFTQNTREVAFIGNTNQTITGINNFDFLFLNNSGVSPNNRIILLENTTVNNRLFLENGLLDLNGFNLTMANLSLIRRSSISGLMSDAPTINSGNQIDLQYDNVLTTGVEYPSSNLLVRDLIITSGTLTLGTNCTFNRDLRLGGDLDLDTYTLSARGRSATQGVNGDIEITSGNRIVSGSAGSTFDIVGLNANSPVEFTKTVTNPGSGTLTFDSDVLVAIGDGRMDWGTGNPVTINGVLQIKLGGSIFPNPCFYGINSILRFANTVDYGVTATDYTWASGSINSGLPGIPWNVEVNDVGTDLQLLDTRSLRGSLIISNGTFSLMPSYSGDFSLGGDWTRTGASSAFTHNNFKVVFDRQSAGNQTITVGSGVSAETFYDLDVSSVNGDLVLASNSDLIVLNNLGFITGKLDLGAATNTITIGTATTNGSITGYSASAYIVSNGGDTRIYSNTNSTYNFPVGDASNYTPLDITLVNGAQTGSFLTGKVVTSAHPNVGTATNFINRYWSIEPTGLAASPSYNISYTFAPGDAVGPAANLYPTKWSSLGWIASPGSSANAIDGTTITYDIPTRSFGWNGLTTFSDFTAAGDGSPLPVELLSFTVNTTDQGNVITNWVTGSEINSSHFIIEKSINAIDFEYVGKVDGAGNSSLVNNYSLKDENPFTGVSYYRLTQFDFNGDSEIFSPVAVNLDKLTTDITLYPNPGFQTTFLKLQSEKVDNTTITVYDVSGRMAYRFESPLQKGDNLIKLDISDLPAGHYVVNLQSRGGLNIHKPLIKN